MSATGTPVDSRIRTHHQMVVIAAEGMINGTIASLDMLLVERYHDEWMLARQKVGDLKNLASTYLSRDKPPDELTDFEALENVEDQAIESLQRIRLLTVRELRERHAEADWIQRRSVVTQRTALIVALILAVVLSMILTGRFVTPLADLAKATQEVSTGSFGVRVRITSDDELGQLGNAFNQMAARLQVTTVSKETLDTILGTMTEALCVVDDGLVIRQTNPAWEKGLMPTGEGTVGKALDDVCPEIAGTVKGFLASVEESDGPVRKEVVLGDEAESRRILSVSLMWVEQLPGIGGAVLLVCLDVTASRNAELELIEFREKMLHAEQLASLGSVAAILSHKLNQPLTVLRLLVQQMLRSLNDKEVLERKLNTAREEIDVVRTQIREVLQYARPIDSQQRSPLAMGPIVTKTAELFTRNFEDHGVSLGIAPLDALQPVLGNKDQLEEAFYILFENALHACQERSGARISVSAEKKDSRVLFSFSDTGSGIPRDTLGRVFEPFFTTKPAAKGTGLGLARLKQIVTAHDGEVWIESETGIGTTVYFTLPVAGPQETR